MRLYLSSNSLTGSLSPAISNLKQAIYIDLSENVYSGTIPSTIGSLQSLIAISLASNHFHGSIPESMGNMLSLEELDLSQNNLSGVIPKSLETLKYLVYLNVSFNELSGEIPSNGSFTNFTYQSFMFNEDLCGSSRFNVSPCHVEPAEDSNLQRILLIVFVSIGGGVVIVAAAVVLVLMKKKQNPDVSGLLSPLRQRRLSYYELQQATDGYSESNLLGVGGYGAVYKGVLSDGTVLAVKVFNLLVEEALRSFDRECEVLRNLRHRNLTKVICSCTNNSFKALVLEYMPNGSLESWLYGHDGFLDFMQRVDGMIGVASALEYLHHGYSTPVIHCDLKPSNVLLDEDMIAHVSDFGLAKMLAVEDSLTHARTLATIGYMAPGKLISLSLPPLSPRILVYLTVGYMEMFDSEYRPRLLLFFKLSIRRCDGGIMMIKARYKVYFKLFHVTFTIQKLFFIIFMLNKCVAFFIIILFHENLGCYRTNSRMQSRQGKS